MSLQTTVSLNLTASLAGTALVTGIPQFPLNLQPLVSGTIPTGTGSAKADQLWVHQYTLASSGTQSIDLTSLGNDPIGVALAPVTLKLLAILMKGNLACGYLSAVAIHS